MATVKKWITNSVKVKGSATNENNSGNLFCVLAQGGVAIWAEAVPR